MKFVLIRHGEIDSNVAKVYSGRSEEALNATGRDQALEAALHLEPFALGRLFTSPLRRARETAEIIGNRLSLKPIVCEAFNELCMGPWEGLSETEVGTSFSEAFALWNLRPADLLLPGRETLYELQARAVQGILRAAEQSDGARFGVVSHVAVIRALMLFTEGRPLNDYKRIHVANASPLPLEWNRADMARARELNGR